MGALRAAAARRRLTIAPVRPLSRALSFLALGGAGLEFGDMLFALDQRFEPIVLGHRRVVLGFQLSRARLIGRGGDLVGALAGFGDDLRLTLPHFFDGHWYSPIQKAPKRGRSDWASAGASAFSHAAPLRQI